METVKKGMELQEESKKTTEEILKQQKQDYQIEEIKKIRGSLKDTAEQIKEIPSAIMEDIVEDKVYDMVDKNLLKISLVFEKGISEMQKKRDLIKAISRQKDEMEKIAEKPLKNAVPRELGGMTR